MSLYNVISRSLMQQAQPEDISVVVANLDAIAAVVNGNIDNQNFGAGQILPPSKLLPEGASDGQMLAWNTAASKFVPVTVTPPVTKPPYSSTPPASPANGDEWVFPADAAGTLWQFRYNASSGSAYKWEFVGGAPLQNDRFAADSLTLTGSLQNVPGGPVLTVPRSGEYLVDLMGSLYGTPVNPHISGMSVANAGNTYYVWGGPASPSVTVSFGFAQSSVVGIAGGAVLQVQASSANGNTWAFNYRSLRLTPRRIA